MARPYVNKKVLRSLVRWFPVTANDLHRAYLTKGQPYVSLSAIEWVLVEWVQSGVVRFASPDIAPTLYWRD